MKVDHVEDALIYMMGASKEKKQLLFSFAAKMTDEEFLKRLFGKDDIMTKPSKSWAMETVDEKPQILFPFAQGIYYQIYINGQLWSGCSDLDKR
jgi:hypothetical protein